MRRFVYTTVFIFLASLNYAQETSSIELTVGISKFDFFSTLNYTKPFGKLSPHASLGFGINRTFFQNRFYPRFTIGSTYKILQKNKFSIGPRLDYSYSFLNVNRNANTWHRWHELNGGLDLKLGGKLFYCMTVQAGIGWERYPNQYTNGSDAVFFFGYYGSMGIGYAL